MKVYRFDYLKEWVNEWNDKSHITLTQLLHLPDDILLPWFMLGKYKPAKDHYGEDIDDISEWRNQKELYLEKLWIELGAYVDPSFSDISRKITERWRKEMIRKLTHNLSRRKTNEGKE